MTTVATPPVRRQSTALQLRRFTVAEYHALIAAGICGSWVGTRLRHLVPQRNFQRLFRWLVTLLALRMIALPVWAQL